MPRVTGLPCPVCGSTNTYMSAGGRILHCRAKGHTVEIDPGQYGDSGGGEYQQQQPQQQQRGSVIGSFGLR